jgi:PAS domain-containing protein
MVVDGALTVVECSRRCLAVFGLRPEGDAAAWAASLTETVAAEEALGDELALATARLLTPGEEEVVRWVRAERTWEVAVSALAGEGDGASVDRFMVWFADVTDRELEEEIQLNARHYLEQVLSDIPVGVVVMGPELRVTSANRKMLTFLERMGGRATLVDAIGASLTELVPGEVGEAWQTLAQRVLAEGAAGEDSRRGFAGDAGELVLATEMTPLRDRRGDLAGVIAMADDVSEEARLQRELVRAEKLATVGQMVITVNHEINNPLTIIAANAQSMRLLSKDMDEKGQKKLASIEKQVRRISEVTERLRTMDEVASSEYIEAGPDMVDIWRGQKGTSEE